MQGLEEFLPGEKHSFLRRTTRGWVVLPISVTHWGSESPIHSLRPRLPVPKASTALSWLQRARSYRSSSPRGLSRSGGSCSVAPRQGSLGLSPIQTGLKMRRAIDGFLFEHCFP